MSLTCAVAAWVGRLHSKRELLNAIFYQLRAGSAWTLLPHGLLPWRTVYKQFEAWHEDGIWERLLNGLRQLTREPEPTAGAIDSQSVRTGGKREATTATMRTSK